MAISQEVAGDCLLSNIQLWCSSCWQSNRDLWRPGCWDGQPFLKFWFPFIEVVSGGSSCSSVARLLLPLFDFYHCLCIPCRLYCWNQILEHHWAYMNRDQFSFLLCLEELKSVEWVHNFCWEMSLCPNWCLCRLDSVVPPSSVQFNIIK